MESAKDNIFLRYGDYIALYHFNEVRDTQNDPETKKTPMAKVPFMTAYGYSGE